MVGPVRAYDGLGVNGSIGGLPTVARISAHETVMDVHHLRLVHDAVLLENGTLNEGMPDGHGRNVFTLATDSPGEAGELLSSLADGDVRSLLIDGGCSLASSFLEAGLVDQAVAYIESSGSTSADKPRLTTTSPAPGSSTFAPCFSTFAPSPSY